MNAIKCVKATRRMWACVTWLMLLSACGDDFKPGYRIDGPRLLALAADQPHARPGERVALELLVVGRGRENLRWAWGACTLPEDSSALGCLSRLDDGLSAFELSAGLPELQVPEGLLDELPEEQRPSALIGVVVVGCPGALLEADDPSSGLPFTCRDADDRALPIEQLQVGVKRVYVRARDRNRNPEIRGITWDGSAWPQARIPEARVCGTESYDIEDCPADVRHPVRVEVSPAEAGVDELGDPFEEQVIIQYYASHGLFRDSVRLATSPENLWAAQARGEGDGGQDRGGQDGGSRDGGSRDGGEGVGLDTGEDTGEADLASLWIVVRDDRGGVAWTRRQVRMR